MSKTISEPMQLDHAGPIKHFARFGMQLGHAKLDPAIAQFGARFFKHSRCRAVDLGNRAGIDQ